MYLQNSSERVMDLEIILTRGFSSEMGSLVSQKQTVEVYLRQTEFLGKGVRTCLEFQFFRFRLRCIQRDKNIPYNISSKTIPL